MNLRRALLLFAIVPLVACTSQVQTRSESALRPEANFRTYAVVDHLVAQRESIDAELEEVIHTRLGELRYERSAPEEADLLISYKLLLSDEQHVAVAPLVGPLRGAGADPQDLGGDLIYVEPARMSESTQEKILLVLVQDRRTLRTLWLGWANGEANTRDIDARTLSALSEILGRLPAASR